LLVNPILRLLDYAVYLALGIVRNMLFGGGQATAMVAESLN